MWSLLFYYALLNAACITVLVVISWDPPISEDEDEGLLPPLRGSGADIAEMPPRQGPSSSGALLFELDRRQAVA